MTDWDRCRSKHVLVENTERSRSSPAALPTRRRRRRQPHSSKQERRHNLPNEACRENISVLLSFQSNFIATAAQCGIIVKRNHDPQETEGCQLNFGEDRKCWTPMIWRYGTRSIG